MASYIQLITIFCCLLALVSTNIEAGQVHQLRRFVDAHKFPTSSSSSSSSSLGYSRLNTDIKSDYAFRVGSQYGQAEADKIVDLPGQPDADFDQYSGYVTVDPLNGRALFYYFVESPCDPSTKPLILWLNGGPGCSSLIGAMEEIGPFRVNSDGETLYKNNYAWNNVANIIFLEAPAGVGFSYSNTSADLDAPNDDKTARDSYVFLLNWFERFPQYKGRDFYITGESYAGHYVPQLAYTIYHNNNMTSQSAINLRGIAVGNGFFESISNSRGVFDYLWSHALISDRAYETIQMKCNFSNWRSSVECNSALVAADKEAGDIDFYNIYAPICHNTSKSTWSGVAMADYDPCTDNYVTSYLNNPIVQKALHANITHLRQPWQICSGHINKAYKRLIATMLPTVKFLIESGLRVWFYSGDIDSVCPTTSTRYFIKSLELSVTKAWRAWYLNEEVGGYVEDYNGVTLVTVRGAGHLVPSYQPERSLTMISSFLEGKLPPS